jgi:hypothetical protein
MTWRVPLGEGEGQVARTKSLVFSTAEIDEAAIPENIPRPLKNGGCPILGL